MTREELAEELKKVAYRVVEVDAYEIGEISDLIIQTTTEDCANGTDITFDFEDMDISIDLYKSLSLKDKPVLDLIFKYLEEQS